MPWRKSRDPTSSTDLRTPVLDRLARKGVRFTDFYANGPACSHRQVATAGTHPGLHAIHAHVEAMSY
jgi:arylsulfatase A-like enzyme